MSMFKSPADMSSDSESSDSGSVRSEHGVAAPSNRSTAKKPKSTKTGTKSPSLLEGSSYANRDVNANKSNELDADTEGHSNMMTAALLEFYCLSRAADLLNAQKGSHKQYTRDSPEVQYLGGKMYNYKSQFLSSHGVIAEGIDKDEWRTTRQYYRDNLDVLGMSALEELNIDDTHRRVPSRRPTGDVVLASKPSNTVQHSDQGYAGPSKRRPYRPGLADIGKRLPSAENIKALETVHLDVGSLPSQSLPLTGSSPASFPLFEPNLPTPYNRLSRYAMEFSEVRILGRGSFGEVYHVKNHIDGQTYAVKKIPISQRRLEQLQGGGENQLESIMKEIRTLARLEHTNVVRYYGAWVEQAHVSGYVRSNHQAHVELESENVQSSLAGPEASDSQSFGVVFEHSQTSARSVEDDEDTESIPRDFDDFTNSQISTFGGTDDDIFTDGLSYDPSKLQIQRRHRGGPQVPAVVLHIQMSLHPISLHSYLNPQPCEVDDSQIPRRHCYHLVPSLRLMLRIISGVEYLHAKGIVHRDLKPANIFLSCPEYKELEGCPLCRIDHGCSSWYSHPRIGDFGLVADISHFDDHPLGSSGTSSEHRVKMNRVVGTEFYRPPLIEDAIEDPENPEEIGSFYRIDESLDVFALGVILFELLYRLSTKMERQFVLSELTRCQHDQSTGSALGRPSFPCDFAQKINMGQEMLDEDVSIAEAVMTCIRGMLEPLPQNRWRCSDVKQRLQTILAVAQGALRS
ncbi:kinase-like domain-containing protein [Aspergillus coremiiformis]|uniref:Kinase-like domain-containing protein n=1 Tax=Aspergillus coremiiformis TaxID=138285 RepID=A0A5N6ZC62_9EURO|nr:kinase-like domain-containing protein [Aspergillus coremiiformis]